MDLTHNHIEIGITYTYIELDFNDLEIFEYVENYEHSNDLDGLDGAVSDLVDYFYNTFKDITNKWTKGYLKDVEDEYWKRRQLNKSLR